MLYPLSYGGLVNGLVRPYVYCPIYIVWNGLTAKLTA